MHLNLFGLLIHFFLLGQRIRPVRATAGTRLAAAIAAEKLDEFGNTIRSRPAQPLKPRGPAKRKRATMDDEDETDADDQNFAAASSTEDEADHSDVIDITNEEVSF